MTSLCELHVHLEGTVRYETAVELAEAHGLPRPRAYEYSDLAGFLEIYRPVAQSMQTSQDFERVIGEHAASIAAQGIAYAEISFNPGLHPGVEWIAGLERGRQRAHDELGVEIAWLVELVRGEPATSGERALDIALATNGVVGLGLVGDESVRTPDIAPLIDRAHAKGLRFMPHAGQTGGPEVVREAIEILGADRIAHGVASLGDESVLRLIAARGICLCVCPSSNSRSDDPAMVGTTLTRELGLATTEFEMDRRELVANAWQYAFRT
jgi:adenosine deaminase